ncbi:hypothetical protein VKT57_005273, partial [Escherichia coli]|nr:hypothetical protein [Escherichia coli]HBB2747885.1 DUF5339 domain-containing protein [Escherichia coli]
MKIRKQSKNQFHSLPEANQDATCKQASDMLKNTGYFKFKIIQSFIV